jgi:hypothetical protein
MNGIEYQDWDAFYTEEEEDRWEAKDWHHQ